MLLVLFFISFTKSICFWNYFLFSNPNVLCLPKQLFKTFTPTHDQSIFTCFCLLFFWSSNKLIVFVCFFLSNVPTCVFFLFSSVMCNEFAIYVCLCELLFVYVWGLLNATHSFFLNFYRREMCFVFVVYSAVITPTNYAFIYFSHTVPFGWTLSFSVFILLS